MKKLIAILALSLPNVSHAVQMITYPAMETVAIGGYGYENSRSNRTTLYLGGLGGGGLLDDERGMRLSYGGRAGLAINSKVSIGGYYNRLPVISNTLGSVNMNFFAGEIQYSPYGYNQGWFIGGKLGTTHVTVVRQGVSNTATGLALVPSIGFDNPIDEHLMWGGEANYLFSSNDVAPQGFSFLGSLKILLY